MCYMSQHNPCEYTNLHYVLVIKEEKVGIVSVQPKVMYV